MITFYCALVLFGDLKVIALENVILKDPFCPILGAVDV